jgi:hypothetical protein
VSRWRKLAALFFSTMTTFAAVNRGSYLIVSEVSTVNPFLISNLPRRFALLFTTARHQWARPASDPPKLAATRHDACGKTVLQSSITSGIAGWGSLWMVAELNVTEVVVPRFE